MTGNCWNCQELLERAGIARMAGNDQKLLGTTGMAKNDWKWMEMARNGWNWLKWPYNAGNNQKWMEMDGMAGTARNGWKWLKNSGTAEKNWKLLLVMALGPKCDLI